MVHFVPVDIDVTDFNVLFLNRPKIFMQKLSLTQSLQQKLSPQQIQFIKLLQVPTAELDTRIEEELEINPALEEGKEEAPEENFDEQPEESFEDKILENLEEYYQDDYAGYKMQGDGRNPGRDDPLFRAPPHGG